MLTIIDSRAFRIKIAEKLKLRDYIVETSKMKSEAQENFDIINVSEWLKKVAVVTQDTKTGVYKVSVEIEDKEMAAKLLMNIL